MEYKHGAPILKGNKRNQSFSTWHLKLSSINRLFLTVVDSYCCVYFLFKSRMLKSGVGEEILIYDFSEKRHMLFTLQHKSQNKYNGKATERIETYNSIQKIRKVLNNLFCYQCVGVDFQYRNMHSLFESSRSKLMFFEQLKF